MSDDAHQRPDGVDDATVEAVSRLSRALEAVEVARELVGGRRHLYEAEMKEDRRTDGHPDHAATPGSAEAPTG